MKAPNAGDSELRRAHHLFLLLVALLSAAFFLWAWKAELDVVSTAPGRVIPSGRLKTVQHLEGGIVREILVQEGDSVKSGQSLMVLEKTESASDVAGLMATAAALQAEIVRLDAEVTGKKTLLFPPDLEKTAPDRVRESRELFRARQNELAGTLAGLLEQIHQRQQDMTTAQRRIQTEEEALLLAEKQLAISAGLLKENLTTEYKHLTLERDISRIKGKLSEDKVALERARSMLQEARQKMLTQRQAFVAEAAENLNKARARLQEITIRLQKREDSLQRTEIRSPVDGIVKTVHIVTQGGVVKPGMALVDVVPAGDRLVVEALLPVEEIGYVQSGQRADVRLASSDSRLFGKISGRVVYISPDATTSPTTQASFYAFRVETDTNAFRNGPASYRLYPGMQVAVSIHIGSRTVMHYLLEPFLNSFTFTFQER